MNITPAPHGGTLSDEQIEDGAAPFCEVDAAGRLFFCVDDYIASVRALLASAPQVPDPAAFRWACANCQNLPHGCPVDQCSLAVQAPSAAPMQARRLRQLAQEIRSYVQADWRASLEMMTEWADAMDAALAAPSQPNPDAVLTSGQRVEGGPFAWEGTDADWLVGPLDATGAPAVLTSAPGQGAARCHFDGCPHGDDCVHAVPAAQPVVVDAAWVEATAQAVYEQWKHMSGWVPWVKFGNSTKQDEARSIARTHLSTALAGAEKEKL